MLTLTLTFMNMIVDLDTLVNKIIKYLLSFDSNEEILDSFLEAIVEVGGHEALKNGRHRRHSSQSA